MKYDYKYLSSIIKERIESGNIKDALELAGAFLHKTSNSSSISQLKSRYSLLLKKNQNGIIDEANAQLESNRISHALLELIAEVDSDEDSILLINKALRKQRNIGLRDNAFTFLGFSLLIVVCVFTAWIIFTIVPIFLNSFTFVSPQTKVDSRKEKIENTKYKRFYFSGIDKQGNIGDYLIYITKDFNWKKGEFAKSERYGIESDICKHIGRHEMVKKINDDNLDAIFAFGNASYEENLNITRERRLEYEESRAEVRARKLASCIGDQLYKLTPVYTINLGKNLFEQDNSKYQRLIVVVGLLRADDFTIHEQALYQGLLSEFYKKNLDFNIREYSKVQDQKLDIKRMVN